MENTSSTCTAMSMTDANIIRSTDLAPAILDTERLNSFGSDEEADDAFIERAAAGVAGNLLIGIYEHVEQIPLSEEDKIMVQDCIEKSGTDEATRFILNKMSPENKKRCCRIFSKTWEGALEKISKLDIAAIIAGMAAGGGVGFYCGGIFGAVLGAIIGGVAAPFALRAVQRFIDLCQAVGEKVNKAIWSNMSDPHDHQQ